MALSNTLTKYKNATTVVTADIANSWFGGLYGSTEGATCLADDPLVAGHVHDGLHADGHAQKVNLVDHVTGQVRNTNLADNAVIRRNVQSFLAQGSAIPEFEVVGSDTLYYFDLSDLRSTIAANGALITVGNLTSNTPGDLTLDDLVFGSDSLDDDGDPFHDVRIIFDKSKSAFRAGQVASTQWDDANRGFNSTAFGLNNTAAGARSFVAGSTNTVSAGGVTALIGGGTGNSISGANSGIIAGETNTVTEAWSIIGAGTGNQIDSEYSFVGAGNGNSIDTTSPRSAIISGNLNAISTSSREALLGSGESNSILASSHQSAVIAGNNNEVSASSPRSGIFVGNGNTVAGLDSAILAGVDNTISSTSDEVFIGSGRENLINTGSDGSVIVGGGGVGVGNVITGLSAAMIGGSNNVIASNYGVIGGGQENNVSNTHGSIIGGFQNKIAQNADYGIAMGQGAVARSYGEKAHSAFSVVSGVDGSSQQSTFIFSAEFAALETVFDMYLDGTAEEAYIPSNSALYMTSELLVTDQTNAVSYGIKRVHLIRANGAGTVSVLSSGTHTEEYDPDADGSWDITVVSSGVNQWRITITHGAISTSRVACCVVRAVQVIHS